MGIIKIFDFKQNKAIEVGTISKTDEEWQKLTPEQFQVTAKKGTETPGTCTFTDVKEEGLFHCVRCGTDLFYSRTKFESGTGWPSYFAPVSELNIRTEADYSGGMVRMEVMCARCRAHLGHVFNDGPPPTGKRYCINGMALRFEKIPVKRNELASFAAGCFWHIEAEFGKVKGVVSTLAGFSGGDVKQPSYEKVCSGTTGHAETVLVEFDPSIVTYEQLLEVFWKIHDPTTPNRQGPDVGEQYRSVIFYHNDRQKEAAERSKAEADQSGRFKNKIVTEILPSKDFYKAEEYHQQYFKKMGK